MSKFILMNLFLTFVVMHGSDGRYKPLSPSGTHGSYQQEEDAVGKKKQHQKNRAREESKQDEILRDEHGEKEKIVTASPSSKKSKKIKKKEAVEDAALKLPAVDRLKLAIKLCDLNVEDVRPASISPNTIQAMRTCADNLSKMTGENTLAKIVAWEHSTQEVTNEPGAKNENQQDTWCCVIL